MRKPWKSRRQDDDTRDTDYVILNPPLESPSLPALTTLGTAYSVPFIHCTKASNLTHSLTH